MKKTLITAILLLNTYIAYSQKQNTNCNIPTPTTFVNTHNDCEKAKGNYKIQFFSTTLSKCNKKIPFDYFVEFDGCTNKYFFTLNSKESFTYCEAIKHLESIKQTFPDAFPKKTSN